MIQNEKNEKKETMTKKFEQGSRPLADAARAIVDYSQGLEGKVWDEIIKEKYVGDKEMVFKLINDLVAALKEFDNVA